DIAMAEHHLHRPKVGAIFEEMRSKAVPEEVRRDMTYASFIPVRHNELPECLSGDVLSPCDHEQPRCVLAFKQRGANSDVSLDPGDRALPQRHGAFLCSFSKRHQKAEIKIEIRHLQRDQL